MGDAWARRGALRLRENFERELLNVRVMGARARPSCCLVLQLGTDRLQTRQIAPCWAAEAVFLGHSLLATSGSGSGSGPR